jgi:alpha-L-fucosidase
VGPTAEGVFPPESVERLEGIGAWMRANGAAVHGTQASPFPSLPWGRATRCALDGGRTRLYLHVFEWPASGRLVVPGLLNEPRGAVLLADSAARPLPLERQGDDLVLSLPRVAPDAIDTVVALDIVGKPDVTIAPVIAADEPIFLDTLTVRIASDRERVELRYTIDGSDPSPASPLAAGPVALASSATVKARAFRGVRAVSPIVEAAFTKVAPRPAEALTAVEPGLRYESVEGDFKTLPDFDALTSPKTGVVAGFDLSGRTREQQFAVRLRGYLRVPADGVYRFFVRSDDGSRLWIGDRLVVDNDGLHSPHEESGFVALAAGLHPITVAMFEQTGGFELEVSWSGPGFSRQRVPASALVR